MPVIISSRRGTKNASSTQTQFAVQPLVAVELAGKDNTRAPVLNFTESKLIV